MCAYVCVLFAEEQTVNFMTLGGSVLGAASKMWHVKNYCVRHCPKFNSPKGPLGNYLLTLNVDNLS
jgi:hypothetical protein